MSAGNPPGWGVNSLLETGLELRATLWIVFFGAAVLSLVWIAMPQGVPPPESVSVDSSDDLPGLQPRQGFDRQVIEDTASLPSVGESATTWLAAYPVSCRREVEEAVREEEVALVLVEIVEASPSAFTGRIESVSCRVLVDVPELDLVAGEKVSIIGSGRERSSIPRDTRRGDRRVLLINGKAWRLQVSRVSSRVRLGFVAGSRYSAVPERFREHFGAGGKCSLVTGRLSVEAHPSGWVGSLGLGAFIIDVTQVQFSEVERAVGEVQVTVFGDSSLRSYLVSRCAVESVITGVFVIQHGVSDEIVAAELRAR